MARGIYSPCPELELNHQSQALGLEKAPSNAHPLLSAEVLVKVVELYFCERCGQSFSEASLLSQHQCLLLPAPEHLELPGALLASASEGQSDPGGSELPGASTQEGSAPERLLCPVCQEAFVQPGQLKEHFKTHRAPSGALPCPERGCHFSTGDRKQLRSHLRHLHGASPVSCACRACPLLFPTRQAMEQHHRTHFPFHCSHCDFITANAKLFWQHRKGHATESPSAMLTAGDPPSSDPHGLDQGYVLPSGMAVGLGPVGAAEAACVCASQLQLEEWGVKLEGWEPCIRASLQHGLCSPSQPGGLSACVWGWLPLVWNIMISCLSPLKQHRQGRKRQVIATLAGKLAHQKPGQQSLQVPGTAP